MEDDHTRFDQIISDIFEIKAHVAMASELAKYINLDPALLKELDLITDSAKEALRRLRENVLRQNELPEFHLAVKQIKTMAEDLITSCKKKITITS